MIRHAAIFTGAGIAALLLCGCQTASETVTTTTTTAPDGSVTQTVTRPLSDPFDAALAEAARELFKEDAE